MGGYLKDFQVRSDADIRRSKFAFKKEILIEEDFIYPAGTSAGFNGANLKWNSAAVGGSTAVISTGPLHGGVVKLTTDTNLNDSIRLFLRAGFVDLDKKPLQEFIFRLPVLTKVTVEVGLYKDANNYAVLRYDSEVSSHFQFASNNAGAGEVLVASSLPAVADKLYHMAIQPTTKQTTWGLSAVVTPLESAGSPTELCTSSHVMADDDAQAASFYCKTRLGGAAKTFDVDAFRLSVGRFAALL